MWICKNLNQWKIQSNMNDQYCSLALEVGQNFIQLKLSKLVEKIK